MCTLVLVKQKTEFSKASKLSTDVVVATRPHSADTVRRAAVGLAVTERLRILVYQALRYQCMRP